MQLLIIPTGWIRLSVEIYQRGMTNYRTGPHRHYYSDRREWEWDSRNGNGIPGNKPVTKGVFLTG